MTKRLTQPQIDCVMIVAENGEALLIDLEICGKGAPFQDESVKPLWMDEKKAIFTLIKNQAKASATLSNMGGFGPHWRDPAEYIGWANQGESWADRVIHSQKTIVERT